MVKIQASAEIKGKNFSPAKAEKETGLFFESKNEAGDTGLKGKYRNKSIPYGSASFKAPQEIPWDKRIQWLAHELQDKIDIIRRNGADEIHFWIGYFHDGQCNCELSEHELKLIANLNIPFLFSVYDCENLDEIE